MEYAFKHKSGLLTQSFNKDSLEPDYSIIHNDYVPKKEYRFKAFCMSISCNPENGSGDRNSRKRKLVTKNVDTCPHCGDYLFWERTELAAKIKTNNRGRKAA